MTTTNHFADVLNERAEYKARELMRERERQRMLEDRDALCGDDNEDYDDIL